MPTVHVAIAVVRDAQDRFLVGRRAPEVALSGFHEFPGGKVESGEDAGSAAARECLEETGLCVTVGQRLLQTGHSYEHANVQLDFFACTPDSNDQPLEPYQWIPRMQLRECRFPPANAGLIDALLRGLFVG